MFAFFIYIVKGKDYEQIRYQKRRYFLNMIVLGIHRYGKKSLPTVCKNNQKENGKHYQTCAPPATAMKLTP